MSNVKQLEKKIVKASEAYYKGKPIYTDAQFDNMINMLRAFNRDSYVLKSVGWGASNPQNKYKHLTPNAIGSLDKVKSNNMHKIDITKHYLASPKLDGLSLVLYYRYGKLWKALTRGDGEYGRDVTSNIGLCYYIEKNLKGNLENVELCGIRGEIAIPKIFEKQLKDKGVVSLRNYAAGLMNRKNGADVDTSGYDMVRFVPYSIPINTDLIGADNHFKSTNLDTLGCSLDMSVIQTYDMSQYNSKENFARRIEYLYDYLKRNCKYHIDGIVITENKMNNFKENSLAIKFESETAEVVVSHVEWGTGKSGTGNIIPVVHFEPVELSGATISKTSGFNLKYIKDNNINRGALLKITRSNEVIPHILETIETGECASAPVICGDCGTYLETSGVHLRCPNLSCPSKCRNRIYKLLEIVEIPHGLSNTTINKWLELEDIRCLEDLTGFIVYHTMTSHANKDNQLLYYWEFLSNTFGNHYCELLVKLVNSIIFKHSLKFATQEFWLITGIPGLGKRVSKKMRLLHPEDMVDCESYDDIMKYLKSKQVKLPINIVEGLLENREIWKGLIDVIPKGSEEDMQDTKDEKSCNICITGKLNGRENHYSGRKEFLKYIKEFGCEETSIKKADFLICNSETSTSKKFKKAGELKIPIVTEEWFNNMLTY
jgi:DNA ligase (NAD+)